jgi:hypothetical protein
MDDAQVIEALKSKRAAVVTEAATLQERLRQIRLSLDNLDGALGG